MWLAVGGGQVENAVASPTRVDPDAGEEIDRPFFDDVDVAA